MGRNWATAARSALGVRTRARGARDALRARWVLRGSVRRDIALARTSELAVVIHLYHLEAWPALHERLATLSAGSHDLFVTLPPTRAGFLPTLRTVRPDARALLLPNHGRDVLPFLELTRLLGAAGYRSVLKLHSKRSAHHPDGAGWRDAIIDSLLPADRTVVAEVLERLEDPSTGLIGPSAGYYPLSFYFPGNERHLRQILTRLYDASLAERLCGQGRTEEGFFGGSMFWARLDALAPLLAVDRREFEPEAAQLDGTMAHAVERLFSLVPRIEGRRMYEVDATGLRERPAASTHTPAWATPENDDPRARAHEPRSGRDG